MDKLLLDSEVVKNIDNLSLTDLEELFPEINFTLLILFYQENKQINDKDLLKLAEDMNFLYCSRLDEVLIKIKNMKLDYSSLNEDLQKEIKSLDKIIKIACGVYHSVGLRKDVSLASESDARKYRYLGK
jgi:hypothetical protein